MSNRGSILAYTQESTFLERARVFNNANESIAANTATALTFNSERFDPFNMHSTSVNTSRITFQNAGRYVVGANVLWADNPNGNRTLDIRVNGTTTIVRNQFAVFVLDADTVNLVETVYEFAVNDYVEAVVTQSSLGALNVLVSANFSPEFWAHRLS